MDIRRFIIFAGLAISSYMLILAWNEDYGQTKQPVASESIATSQTAEMSDLPDTSVPVQTDSDAPSVGGETTLTEQPLTVASGDIVRVTTDVFNLAIDPKGGEVVSVALPQYPASLNAKDTPFVLMDSSHAFTYVAQSGLLGKNGIDKDGPVTFSSEATEYQLAEGEDSLAVEMTYQADGVNVKKIFTFTRGSYLVDVAYEIENQTAETWQGVFYAQLKRDRSGDPHSGNAMGMQSYLGTALTTNDEAYKKYSFDDLDDNKFKENVDGGWAAILQHYFVTAWIANPDQPHTFNGRKAGDNYIIGFYDKTLMIPAGETQTAGAKLYAGPKIQNDLAQAAPNLELTVDYGWLWWIAQPLFAVLDFIQTGKISIFGFDIDLGTGVGNWGVAIILLTVLIKLAFFKLSATSYRSMANMRKVAPKMTAIREKYGDNREKLGQEMMALYKKEKINPLGGCLPILVQMPVFIALYWVLMESVELRQAPFFLWIEDLSVKDPFFILPLIMGASMFIQMRLNPQPQDPMQAQVMKFMPVIFTVFFLWFPAGLVLYWVVNNVLSIAQQWYITRQIENEN